MHLSIPFSLVHFNLFKFKLIVCIFLHFQHISIMILFCCRVNAMGLLVSTVEKPEIRSLEILDDKCSWKDIIPFHELRQYKAEVICLVNIFLHSVMLLLIREFSLN